MQRITHTKSALRCALVAGTLLGSASLQGAEPDLRKIVPRGGQRGTEIEITLQGNRLEDAQELMFYQSGLEVVDFKPIDGRKATARLRIADDCRLGVQQLRLRTASGVSDLRTFYVGALPVVDEVEPNTEFDKAQPVVLNTTIAGTIESEDADHFVFEAKKGERINFEVEAIRLGDAFFDVYLALLDENREELMIKDDVPLVWQDAVASFVPPADGKYVIQLRDTSYGGSGDSHYRLHVGTFPRPTGIFPAGGKPGETVTVQFLGDRDGDFEQTFELPATVESEYGLFASSDQGIAPSWNWFRLSDLDNVLEQEPNNEPKQATGFQPPYALNGVLSEPGDVDVFRFSAKKGERYDVRVHARSLRSALDSVVTIRDDRGRSVANNDDTGGPDSYIRFTAPQDGEYTLHVEDQLAGGGPSYFYRVELTPVQPQLEVTITEYQRYVQPIVTVPRGNRETIVLSASRRDFAAALEFWSDNLPEGVTIEAAGMPDGQNLMPIVFAATEDAPLAGSLAKIRARSVGDKPSPPVEGFVRQDVMLVRGRNNRSMWTEKTERVPVVVAEAAPFSVEIVEPKVPIVQGGSLQLKVLAKRAEGYDKPIKIELVWNPPGVSSSRSISIPEGKSEAVIPVNAADSAAIGDWSIVARAEAEGENGTIHVATPLAKLRVAERYVNLAFQSAAVEQGSETELYVTVEPVKAFEGKATVQLLGLPNKVETPTTEITKETKDLVFKVKADADAPAGQNKNLFCRIVITENGEPIVHDIGSGQLRVDKPLERVATPVAVKATEDAPKRLSRLEQLRLEQKARLEAGASGSQN